jgi:RNA polymerase sigma-70 factor (ECF subfamily)
MSEHEKLRSGADWQAELYRRYHRKVYGICLYFLKDREEAKDAAQDVFIKAYRAWGEFEWKCDPLTWIGAIAKHDCFSRRLRRRKILERQASLAAEEPVDVREQPDDLVLHRICFERALPETRGKLREILRLALDGLNHREISIRMGVSRVAITRSLTRFRKRLADPRIPQVTSVPAPERSGRTSQRQIPRAAARPAEHLYAGDAPLARLIAA